jgi:hypothetical protein
MGMGANVINVPLGHPGDALRPMKQTVPLTPPQHWRLGVGPDGRSYSGTSLHPPATKENAQALRRLQAMGVRQVFLDDDFRLARSPGVIGGCYCTEHVSRFLRSHGYRSQQREDLLEAVSMRDLTPLLRNWIDFGCDELTASFRSLQAAAPQLQLGVMVMYLGAEKAGIRLADYRSVPFRVGEAHFEDASFQPVKGKTDELFSALFHRRFVSPHLAYSETTAFPADQLSAANMAAKLAVGTLSDLRHTMFMSGLTTFPNSHWQVLAPAMRKMAALHRMIAGHKPRGPFRHYWGEHSRCVGDDKPYSLFLATGLPFEVDEHVAQGGWTFLADADARAVSTGRLRPEGTAFVFRPESGLRSTVGRAVAESLSALFEFKQELLPRLRDVPVVIDAKPVVCAWYPTVQSVILWNLSGQSEAFRLRLRGTERTVTIEGLGTALLRDIK